MEKGSALTKVNRWTEHEDTSGNIFFFNAQTGTDYPKPETPKLKTQNTKHKVQNTKSETQNPNPETQLQTPNPKA